MGVGARRTGEGVDRGRGVRRGMVYLFVLCMSLLVVVIGVSAVSLGRIRLRESRATAETAQARSLARSAIEIGLAKIKADDNWRTTLGVGVWMASTRVGSGGMKLEATAIDTSVPSNDAVTLLGTGVCGGATQMMQVVVRRGAVVETPTWKRVVN